MYYIEVRYYGEKEFIDERREERGAINIDGLIKTDPLKSALLYFETVEDAQDYFNANLTAYDMEEQLPIWGTYVRSVRYIVRNSDDSSYSEVIAQATRLFKVERFC